MFDNRSDYDKYGHQDHPYKLSHAHNQQRGKAAKRSKDDCTRILTDL